LFNFHSFVTVVLLLICTCTYLKMHFPSLLIRRTGWAIIPPLHTCLLCFNLERNIVAMYCLRLWFNFGLGEQYAACVLCGLRPVFFYFKNVSFFFRLVIFLSLFGFFWIYP
ncbi:hypothetical protein BAE44_0006189, partial [Dichanthelium oligosanthes]